ncbi:parathyroid hormone/parathyroid hormone-related peptide receptor [Elysia marginata]|uniref:Parathyroid hormone/parathyroid hormone-related peptide receptor n=1 Tax=Elysia marginata TaxID=1093978 RepID=A0AAV4ICE7_9GAST|nr:parathyroid hormone/parathyroid hormone-related peptide receptor [Elysia marginata]
MEDEPRSGRPVTACGDANISKILVLLSDDRRKTCEEISTETSMSRTSVFRVLTNKLNNNKKFSKWVPHLLTDEQKEPRSQRKVEVPVADQTRVVQEAFRSCLKAHNGSLMLPIPGAFEEDQPHDHLAVSSGADTHCPPIWDGLACWPRTRAGVTAVQPCPNYVNEFLLAGTVTREA